MPGLMKAIFFLLFFNFSQVIFSSNPVGINENNDASTLLPFTLDIPDPGCSGCPLEGSWGNDYMWAMDLSGNGSDWKEYDNANLTLCKHDDGTFTITGAIVNGRDAWWDPSTGQSCGLDDAWWLEIRIFDRQQYGEFRGNHEEADGCNNYQSWDYWDMEGALTGMGCNQGQTVSILGPKPGYRLQVGWAADSYHCDKFGLSTWMASSYNGRMVQTDIYATIDPDCYFNIIAPELDTCAFDLDAIIECRNNQVSTQSVILDWHNNNLDTIETCLSTSCPGGVINVTSDFDYSQWTSACLNTGSITVTYTATDECQNSFSVSASLRVEDTEAPDTSGCTLTNFELDCADIIDLNQQINNWHENNLNNLQNCVYDACGNITITSDFTLDNYRELCGLTGEITIEYFIRDDCGNEVWMDAIFRVVDNTPPSIIDCDINELNIYLDCEAVPNDLQWFAMAWHQDNLDYLNSCAADYCGSVVITDDYDFDHFIYDCGNNGTLLVIYYLTDECDNIQTLSAILSIQDTIPPDTSACILMDFELDCESVMDLDQQITDWHNSNLNYLQGCTYDACGDVTITSDFTLDNYYEDCGSTGEITVEYFIRDDCDNEVSMDAVFRVADTTAPSIIDCDVSALSDSIDCGALAGDLETVSTDWHQNNIDYLNACIRNSCSSFSIVDDYDFATFSYQCGNTGSLDVQYFLTDECQNTFSILATLTIIDTIAPDTSGCVLLDVELDCGDLVDLDQQINSWHAGNLNYLQNCVYDVCSSIAITSDFNPDNYVEYCGLTGEIIVEYTIADECSNEVTMHAAFRVVDQTPPSLVNCDIDAINAYWDCGLLGDDLESVVASWHQDNLDYLNSCVLDSCTSVTISDDYDFGNFIFDCGRTGSLLVRYYLNDECQNQQMISAIFTVLDTIAPTLVYCPNNHTVSPGSDISPESLGYPTYSDQCTGYLIRYQDDTISNDLCTGVHINRNFIAADSCGNENVECVQEIIIQGQDSLPEIPDLFLNCGADLPDPQLFIDAHPQYSITVSTSQVSRSCGEAFIRIWTITANCTHIIEQRIYFDDDVPPSIIVPNDTTITCDAPVPEPWYISEDNCSEISVDFQEEVVHDDCECNKTIIRRWKLTDGCGNITEATQSIHILDTVAPTITINNPAMQHIQNGSTIEMYGCNPPGINMMDFTTSDCCITIDTAYDRLISFKNCETLGYAQLWECVVLSRDLCGNEARFSFNVIQYDTTSPVLHNVPDDIILSCDELVPAIDASVFASDDCDTDFTPEVEEELSFNADSTQFLLTRRWIATDYCGNTTIGTQTITGCYSPSLSPDGSIRGFIWGDSNKNGIQDDPEIGMSGIKVHLFKLESEVVVKVGSVLTGSQQSMGQYQFEGLSAGQYFLEVELPDSMQFTSTNVGEDDELDNDFYSENNQTDIFGFLTDDFQIQKDGGLIYLSKDAIDPISIICLDTISNSCDLDSVSYPMIQSDCKDSVNLQYFDSYVYGDCGISGIERTWLAVDCEGQRDTCVQYITVIDTVAPEIICYADTIYLSSSEDLTNYVTMSDECSGSITLDFIDSTVTNCDVMTLHRKWVAFDCAGNSSSHLQVFIFDLSHISCPGDTVLLCDQRYYVPEGISESQVVNFRDDTISMDCKKLMVERTWHFLNCEDTIACSQIVTWIDTTTTSILDVIETLHVSSLEEVILPDWKSGCFPPNAVSYEDEVDLDSCGNGKVERVWTIEKCDALSEKYLQVIWIQDTIPPAFIKGSLVHELTIDEELHTLDFGVPQYESCSEYVLEVRSDTVKTDDCSTLQIARKFYAEDGYGNIDSSVTQVIYLKKVISDIDVTTLPTDTTIYCGDSIPESDVINLYGANFEIEIVDSNMVESCGLSILRSFKFNNACSEYLHHQVITIEDTVDFEFKIPKDTIIYSSAELPLAVEPFLETCTPIAWKVQEIVVPDSLSCNQNFLRIYTVDSECYGTMVDTQFITIVDTTTPDITLYTEEGTIVNPGDTFITFQCEGPGIIRDFLDVESSCDFQVEIYHERLLGDGVCYSHDFKEMWKTFISVEDLDGNIEERYYFIGVKDTSAPILEIGPREREISCTDSIPVFDEHPSVLDFCGDEVTILATEEVIYGDDSSQYAIQRYWNAIDPCGNSSDYEQTIYVCGFRPESLRSRVGGIVWNDKNHDGYIDEDEPMFGEAMVHLLQLDNQGSTILIDSMHIDTSENMGHYSFENVEPGTYRVRFVIPANAYFTIQGNIGSENDSDADVNSGYSDVFDISFEKAEDHINAGVGMRNSNVPVGIRYFEVFEQDCEVNIRWGTDIGDSTTRILLEQAYDLSNYTSVIPTLDVDSFDELQYGSIKLDIKSPKAGYRLSLETKDKSLLAQSLIVMDNRTCFEDLNKVVLYPNPVQSDMTLLFKGTSDGNTTVRITDLRGHQLLEWKPLVAGENHLEHFSVSELPAGTYIVTINYQGRLEQLRLIKI